MEGKDRSGLDYIRRAVMAAEPPPGWRIHHSCRSVVIEMPCPGREYSALPAREFYRMLARANDTSFSSCQREGKLYISMACQPDE